MSKTQPQLCTMTAAQRLKIANQIYISYPRFKEILGAIEYCHHFSCCKDEPECMFLSGATGVGKTTIYRTYASKYPRQITPAGTNIPILAVTIPAPATVKTVVSKLLWQLGDPAYDKGSTGKQTIRLIGLMMVYLKPSRFSNLSVILNLVVDLRSRCYLGPFVWQPDNGEEFRTFLHLLESQLPLESASYLSELDLARRFYYASDGVIAYVMKLIRYGTYLALQQHREQLDLGILAVAFEKYVHADKAGKVNPFLSDEFQLQEPEAQSALAIGATNNRLKSKPKKRRDPASPTGARERSTRQPKASSILTTR